MPRCLRLVRRFLAPVAARGAASLGAARVSSLRQAQRPSRLSAVASASHWTRRSARGFRSSAFVALDEKRGEEGRQGDEDDKQVEEFEDFEEEEDDEDGESANEAETENAAAKEYLGVVYNATKIKKYSAELELDGHIISGGDYWTALDAARAYDELVDLYCDLDTPRNFASASSEDDDTVGDYDDELSTSESEWETPEVGKRHADIIPPIPQTYLTLEEVTDALEREKAIDVYTVDLEGKSSLADYMIFTTGRSQAHMRRMADLLIRSMKARRLDDDFDYAVEGRDCDDWMIADCNNIVVHFLREDTRRILNLEDHWENMVDDKHRIYGDMTEDEYMDKFGTSELMEYLEDDDFAVEDDGDDEEESAKRAKRRARRQAEQGEKEDDLDWK